MQDLGINSIISYFVKFQNELLPLIFERKKNTKKNSHLQLKMVLYVIMFVL